MVWEWLDAARYADTNGYQGDPTRAMWYWRDWAIKALNDNMPFDHFTIEQLAGDLLPNPTREQLIATGFHRNHMINGEGGRIAEESRVDYVQDRVETTGTVWLGLTLNVLPLPRSQIRSDYADASTISSALTSIRSRRPVVAATMARDSRIRPSRWPRPSSRRNSTN